MKQTSVAVERDLRPYYKIWKWPFNNDVRALYRFQQIFTDIQMTQLINLEVFCVKYIQGYQGVQQRGQMNVYKLAACVIMQIIMLIE